MWTRPRRRSLRTANPSRSRIVRGGSVRILSRSRSSADPPSLEPGCLEDHSLGRRSSAGRARPAAQGKTVTSIGAIIFDLDGVLVDTEIWWDEARIAFAASQGRTWTEADRAAIMGSNTRECRARMRERVDVTIPEEEIEQAVIGAMLARYEDEAVSYTHLRAH